jgi:hypothetical protein
MHALDQWQASKAHLQDAVHAFLASCQDLQIELLKPSHNQPLLEDVISKVYSQSQVVALVTKTMAESHTVLNGIFNISTKRVPANLLPPETLARIFFIVNQLRLGEYPVPTNTLVVLASVCARWRQVATTTRSLWSYVQVGSWHMTKEHDPRSMKRARLWLERAQGVPLHIHFQSSFSSASTDLIAILQPHAAKIASFFFEVQCHEDTIQAVFNLCTSHGMPGSVTALIVPGTWSQARPGPLDWPITFFRGLTELQLSHLSGSQCLSLRQLSAMLSSSPSLHTLRLRSMSIIHDQTSTNRMISLPNLRLLDLNKMADFGLLLLLPLLSTSASKLHVRLWLSENPSVISTVRSFFKRTKVFSLSLGSSPGVRQMPWLESLPHMRLLFLDCEETRCQILKELVVQTAGKWAPRCPELHTLCLVGGKVYPRATKLVVPAYSLGRIVFASCYFPVWGDQGIVGHEEPDDDTESLASSNSNDSGGNEDSDGMKEEDSDGSEHSDSYVDAGLLSWVSQHVKVVVAKHVAYRNNRFWDSFVQEEIDTV